MMVGGQENVNKINPAELANPMLSAVTFAPLKISELKIQK